MKYYIEEVIERTHWFLRSFLGDERYWIVIAEENGKKNYLHGWWYHPYIDEYVKKTHFKSKNDAEETLKRYLEGLEVKKEFDEAPKFRVTSDSVKYRIEKKHCSFGDRGTIYYWGYRILEDYVYDNFDDACKAMLKLKETNGEWTPIECAQN